INATALATSSAGRVRRNSATSRRLPSRLAVLTSSTQSVVKSAKAVIGHPLCASPRESSLGRRGRPTLEFMRRTVFYPVHAGAAGAAASLLADEFDMRKLGPDEVVASTVPLVFLADADGPDRPPGPNVRVIGLVDPRRPG